MKTLIVTLSLIYVVFTAMAQSVDLDHKGPLLQEGRMFSLKLVPAGKKLEVQLIGKDVADVDLKTLTLSATAQSGDESWGVNVIRDGSRLWLDNPAGARDISRLNLKVKVVRKKQTEEFQFTEVPAPH